VINRGLIQTGRRNQHRTRLAPIVATALFLPAAALADAKLSAAIDAVFADFDVATEPGCAAGVIHRGEYVHQRGYGLANMEYGAPLTPQSVFRMGSVSKQFTAMAIAILAERGDLDLDADVHTYLPDLMDYGHEVTVRQMVHHIAGMGDYDLSVFNKADGSEFRFGNEDYSTIDEFYAMVTKAGLIHEPGSRYEYSNLGYFLLAHVVERVSGRTLRQFADAEIFRPLGMDNSRFNDNVDQVIPNRAYGYRQMDDGSWEVFMTNLDYVGDGGVFTSLDDFIKWDQNFYDNKLGDGTQALIETVETPHPDTIEMTDDGPRNVHYAFGLRTDEVNGEYMIGHGGSWVAFTTNYSRFPDLNMSTVVLCNSYERSAYDLNDEVTQIAVAWAKEQ
jgi:CubicO group peptidase (beta-lactamase class C family)